MGISIAMMMLMYSLFHTWYGGYCFGPRFLTDILPALAIFLGISLDGLQHNVKGSALILVVSLISLCLAWSIFVQLVGAFYYPNGSWDSDPDIDTHRERLWDWKDTQIMRSFHAGFVSPVNFINKFIFIINDKKKLRIDASVDSTV
ncbi:MAG: hypothetical protein MUO26_06920 [Methanotrichaceae archaeon]|nr:hypothetical protein [Methanotrichaceae archaeon]